MFKVLKTPVPLDKTPEELRALIGYEFFKVDPETGKARELDEVFGPDAQRDFWLKLDDLAHDIVHLLEALESSAATQPPVSQPSAVGGQQSAVATPAAASVTGSQSTARDLGFVYLALTTSDLREQREALKRDLQQQGFAVLPDHSTPDVADEARAAIAADLDRSRMSIHLIGRNYGLVPEGDTHSLVEIQHELATTRAAKGDFSRLIWIPTGQTVTDQRQQRVIEALKHDPRITGRADLLETYFEDLRTMMKDWLTEPEPAESSVQPPATVDAGVPRLYIVADPRDAAVLGPWAERLFEERL